MSCYRTRFRTRSRGLRGDVLINEYSLVQARELRSADYLVARNLEFTMGAGRYSGAG